MVRIYRISAEMVAGGRSMVGPRLSPDGRWVAFVAANASGNRLQLVPAEVGPERNLAMEVQPVAKPGALVWLPGSAAVATIDRGGGITLVSTAGTLTRRIDLAPLAHLLAVERGLDPADHEDMTPTGLAVAPDGRRAAVVLGHRLVVTVPLDGPGARPPLDLASETRVLSDSAGFVIDPTWSPDGSTIAWHEWDDTTMPFLASRIVARDAQGAMPGWIVAGDGGPVASGEGAVAVAQPRFGPDGRLGFLCDAHGMRNLWVTEAGAHGEAEPLLEEDFEHGPPTWGPGDRTWCWGPDGFVAYTRNEVGFGRLLLTDLRSGWRRYLAKGIHTDLEWSEASLSCLRSGARTPDQLESYDTQELLERFRKRPEVDPDALAEKVAAEGDDGVDVDLAAAQRLVEGARAIGAFPLTPAPRRRVLGRGPQRGFDAAGLVEPDVVRWAVPEAHQVAGRLYRPDAEHLRLDPPPMLVWVHGGPTDQWQVTFRPKIAYFVERGWAVLVPDHRGTSGHGRRWQDHLGGQWGRVDVDDVGAAVVAAEARGWCDPDRVVVIGASAGGTTALGVVARPDHRCRAAVAIAPVCDPVAAMGTGHRWERAYDAWLVGVTDAPPRFPIDLADRIDVPVLLLHGDADPVVDPDQSERIAQALRSHGVHVEHHRFPGAGHSLVGADLASSIARIDDFLETLVIA